MSKTNTKIKIFMLIVLLMCVALTFASTHTFLTFASIDDFGSKQKENTTQTAINEYSTLGTYNLYVDGDASATESLYTTKFVNLASIDPAVSSFTVKFLDGDTLYMDTDQSTSSSNRNAYASTAFNITSNLAKAGSNGYLDVLLKTNAYINNEEDMFTLRLSNGMVGDSYDTFTANIISEATSSSTSSMLVSTSIHGAGDNGYMAYFYCQGNNSRVLIGRHVKMHIINPQVVISSADLTAPTVSFDCEQSWTNQDRLVRIVVADNESGIQNVKINGNLATKISGNDKVNVYEYTFTENGVISVEVTDNVNNTQVYSYEENHIDKVVPVINFVCGTDWIDCDRIVNIDTTDVGDSGYKCIKINGVDWEIISGDKNNKTLKPYIFTENGGVVVEVEDNAGNKAVLNYYENHIDKIIPIVSLANVPNYLYANSIDFEVILEGVGPSKDTIYYTLDESIPNESSDIWSIGNHTLDINKDTTIKVVAIDELGHCSEVKIYTVTLRHLVSLQTKNCCVEMSDCDVCGDESGVYAYHNQVVTIDCIPYEYCTINKVLVNGVEQDDFYNSLNLSVTSDVEIEIYYIFNLKVVTCITKYTFDPYDCVFGFDCEFNTNNLPKIEYGYYQNGLSIDNPKNVGDYQFVWEYIDDDYVGNGIINFEIVPYQIRIVVDDEQGKIYGEEDSLIKYNVYNCPTIIDPQFNVYRNIGENVGEYEYNISHILDDNYDILFECDSVYQISPKKLVVIVDNKQKVFGEDDVELTYTIVGEGLAFDDELDVHLLRESGEDVGCYEISLINNGNDNYQLLIKKGLFTVSQKILNISVDDKMVVYGESSKLTFTADCDYNGDYIYGDLYRVAGNSAGIYTIFANNLYSYNYKLNILNNGKYIITAKPILVTACGTTKVYGEEDNLLYDVEGLVLGDVLKGKLSRVSGEDVGVYDITLGSLNNSNYVINFIPNQLVITPAVVNVEILDISSVYGEDDKDFIYTIDGLKFNDNIKLPLYRESGNNAGKYTISCRELHNDNYVLGEVVCGAYIIEKATIIPNISSQKYVYDGKSKEVKYNFPFECVVVCKMNGIVVDDIVDAGIYQVQIMFNGNENYNASKSNVVNVEVKKQVVCLTLTDNNFIYDGTIKFPEFYYDKSCGLDINTISYVFENDQRPVEVGEYKFVILTSDSNYECSTSGVLTIAKPFEIDNEFGLIECKDATFDELVQNIQIIESAPRGKFNKQQILKCCTFETDGVGADGYVYTVKIKADDASDNVYIYELNNDNTYREMVVTKENGYYVFKVDNLSNSFIITKDIEPMPLWFWLVVMGSVILALVLILIIIKNVKNKGKKSRVSTVDMPKFELE